MSWSSHGRLPVGREARDWSELVNLSSPFLKTLSGTHLAPWEPLNSTSHSQMSGAGSGAYSSHICLASPPREPSHRSLCLEHTRSLLCLANLIPSTTPQVSSHPGSLTDSVSSPQGPQGLGSPSLVLSSTALPTQPWFPGLSQQIQHP